MRDTAGTNENYASWKRERLAEKSAAELREELNRINDEIAGGATSTTLTAPTRLMTRESRITGVALATCGG